MRLYKIEPIELTLVRKYHTLTDRKILEQELKEIKIENISDFNIKTANDIKSKSTPLKNVTIDGLQLYAYNTGIDLALILFDEDANKVAAFACFKQAPHLRAELWQVIGAQSWDPYKGKGLVGKIYKFCKEQLYMSIQSDIEQSLSAKKLWTKTLPNLGLHPKIIDLTTMRVYDNDGSIDVYSGKEPARYCWIIEHDDRYRNQIPEGSIAYPNEWKYVRKEFGYPNSPIY